MSRFFAEREANEASAYLSSERLGTFMSLTQSGSVEAAIELHQATMNVGIAMMAVIGLVEIGLRNAASDQIERTFSAKNWLIEPIHGFRFKSSEVYMIDMAKKHAQRAEYAKLDASDKRALDENLHNLPEALVHSKLAKLRQSTINVSNGQVLSQLTLKFWKWLFSEDYEQILWRRCLKKVFPNKSYERSDISPHLEAVYLTRNRLAHFEPVFGTRLEAALKSIDFLIQNLGAKSPSHETVFAKLIMPQRDILEGQTAIFESTFRRLKKAQ